MTATLSAIEVNAVPMLLKHSGRNTERSKITKNASTPKGINPEGFIEILNGCFYHDDMLSN